MSALPVRNQTRAASSPGTRAEHAALPGARKLSAGTSELHDQAAPQARGSGMASVRATRGAAPATARRPARGTAIRMPCRHASRSAAGRATRRQPPGGPRISRKSIDPPGATPATDRNANSPQPSWHTGRRQPRHSRPGASTRLSAAREAGMGTPRTLSWPSVEKPTVRTDRPGGPDAVRYASVDTATHRPTVTYRDTGCDKKKRSVGPRFRSRWAVFRWWWPVLGSNQRRLSRRFYRPLSFYPSQTPLTSGYAL
jgi:hypothetical protein